MTLRSAASSLEFLRLPISAVRDGEAFDPTTDDVDIAVVAAGTAPIEASFLPGEWEDGGPPYIARILIGPGSDIELEAGRFDVYWRVASDPELPVVLADSLVVYSTLISFASVTELAERQGLDLDPEDQSAAARLADATAFIRSVTGQHISAVAGDEQELAGTWSSSLWLPQRPVTNVSAVEIRRQNETVFTTVGVGSITWTRLGRLVYPGSWWGSENGVVKVTYDHGYDQIPEEIVAVTCSIAARAIANPAGQILLSRSKTIGGGTLAETYGEGAAEAAGGVGLTGFEQTVLKRYSWQMGA